LPRAREEPTPTGASGTAVTVKGHGKVLVVDDNHDVAMVTQALLRAAGFEVSWAGGGQDALDAIKDGAYDVVVSDILMPGMSGLDLAARLRIDRPDLPVVLMTGYSDVLADGATTNNVVLQKPFSEAEAVAAIGRARASAAVRS
ncbi:MAG: response regulator, partial [Caulobacteraceae bacterium]